MFTQILAPFGGGAPLSRTAGLDENTQVTTSYMYNTFGEVLTATDPLGNVTINTYDSNGNLLTVTTPTPDGNISASVTQFAYDTKAELTQITDPLNHLTTLSYYPMRLIQSITDAQNNVTTLKGLLVPTAMMASAIPTVSSKPGPDHS